MSSVTVDVVLPVYNGAAYLREAIQSLLDQTYSISNIFVLDDGSTDETIDVVKGFQSPLIQLYQSSENKGIVYQLNKGIELSSAKYIARMDADDVCFPQRLDKQITFLENNREYIACSGGFEQIDGNGNSINKILPSNAANDGYATPAYQHFLHHPFLVVKADSLKAINGYRLIHHCEDADLYYRLTNCGKLYNIKELLGKYRIHQASISNISESNNKIQSLHSQIASIFFRNNKFNLYSENQSLILHAYFKSNNPTIEKALHFSSDLYLLNEEDRDWLYVAFPIKYLQNIRMSGLKINTEDLLFYLKIIKQLLISNNSSKYSCLKLIFKLIKRHLTPSIRINLSLIMFFIIYKIGKQRKIILP